jgi:hypothetical protein
MALNRSGGNQSVRKAKANLEPTASDGLIEIKVVIAESSPA